jgi:hypothetical protein
VKAELLISAAEQLVREATYTIHHLRWKENVTPYDLQEALLDVANSILDFGKALSKLEEVADEI